MLLIEVNVMKTFYGLVCIQCRLKISLSLQRLIVQHYVNYESCTLDWGGAESRGNGARPVELMIMSDTCATHRSRVPRRSSGRIKGGATTVEDERGPGLDFSLCFVCGSRPWGAATLLLCLFMLLKSVECSPVPASFFPFYELCYNDFLFFLATSA